MPLTAWEHSRRLLETPNGPFQSFSRLNPGQPERHQGGRKDQGGRKGSIGQPARQHQGGAREVGKNHLDSLGGHPGGRKVSIGQPARHQGGTREAGKNHLDSLGDTRRQERIHWTACEAPGKQERTYWTACEAPGRHQGGRKGNWTAWEAPGRHQGGRKEPFGQPGRHPLRSCGAHSSARVPGEALPWQITGVIWLWSVLKSLLPKPSNPTLGEGLPPVLGEGRLEKSCLGRLLESSGFAWATTSSLDLNIYTLPVLGSQTNFWESSLIGLHTWA